MLPSMALPSMSWMLLSCLMLLSQIQAKDAQMEQLSASISCPGGSKAYGSYCYAFFLTPKAWMEANMAYQKWSSGHLVSLASGAEGSFVASLMKSISNSYINICIGLHYPTLGLELNGGGWEWRNTGVLYYFAWKKDPSTIINHGHCESLSRITGNKKQFFYNCEQRLLYVCEFKN
ncbi:PREDICTED: regenerating islet-derived protein 3-gamma-like isoform X1 [Elephantulus edwardii]|uniref:regenerating islet-derived protein 3-gamma-like isoform X1 n=1 Tax=Elephantulus edwardii TaxID=28737 RepID=UPI0003F0C773|nr:PREDICTED: regenerating islet-derived protein 3-gamma-like isoform X1 [Elephantulus edwardii]